MKKSGNILLVSVLLAAVVGMVATLAGKTPGNSGEHSQAKPSTPAPKIATAPPDASVGLTPNLTKVDSFQLLDPISVGKPVPAFKVKDAEGKILDINQFKGKKNVVLVFYQGSFCPVCGHQLENLQTHLSDFKNQDAEIVAVSADDMAHAQQTLGEHGLSFKVVPDANKEIIKKFGVGNIAKGGIAWPASFVVDKHGIIRFNNVNKEGRRLHSSDLLPVLSKLTGKPAPTLTYEQ